jgi:hypothetical protein
VNDIVGIGEYTYRIVENWAKLPAGWKFADVGGAGVDAKDNVYIFHRGEHPLIVLDRNGHYVRSWGDGVFTRPHGVHMGPDETIYLTDDGDHSVRKCTLGGRGRPVRRRGRLQRLAFAVPAAAGPRDPADVAEVREDQHNELTTGNTPWPQLTISPKSGSSPVAPRASAVRWPSRC